MTKVILLCGLPCSGKTTYSENFKDKAVVLSCDELMLSLFPAQLGDKHDEISQKVKNYLLNLSLDILRTHTDIILDFGFWTKADRENTISFYQDKGYTCEVYYLKVSNEQLIINLHKRNAEVEKGLKGSYFIDENILNKALSLFEEPDQDENVIIVNN